MAPSVRLLGAFALLAWLQVAVVAASDQQIVYIRNTCECWSTDLKCVCKIESDPTSVRPLMQRLVNRTAEYYWQDVEFQSMVYDRTTFILANTFADGPFPSGITFKGDFSIVNDSFNHLNMTLQKVELNFETFSGRKPKFSKQYWRYIFDHGEGTLRTLRIIKYQIEDFIIPNYLGAALTQEVRPLTEFKVVGCEVKEVKERAFKNFTQLEVLDLSDNHLTTLPENVFSRNINLQKILLANNQISFLTKTIFDGLPNLLLINLRKNKLTAVPAIPRHTNRRFQPMVYLMADNSIHCRCSLIWVLHELTFHHNLEIEATCSDPTMVRGMPIIEGFTRMDKEACYRLIRKEDEGQTDGPAQLAGPAAAAAAAAAAQDAELQQQQQRQQQQQQQQQTRPLSGLLAQSNQDLASRTAATGRKQSSANEPAQFNVNRPEQAPSKAGAPEESLDQKSVQTNQQSGAAATSMSAETPDSQLKTAAASKPQASVASLSSLLAARAQTTQEQNQAPPAAVNQMEAQSQAAAPQTATSGADAASGLTAAKQPVIELAPSQSAQFLNAAQQTVLTAPSQLALPSPVAALAPATVQQQPQAALQQSYSTGDQQAAAPAQAPKAQ